MCFRIQGRPPTCSYSSSSQDVYSGGCMLTGISPSRTSSACRGGCASPVRRSSGRSRSARPSWFGTAPVRPFPSAPLSPWQQFLLLHPMLYFLRPPASPSSLFPTLRLKARDPDGNNLKKYPKRMPFFEENRVPLSVPRFEVSTRASPGPSGHQKSTGTAETADFPMPSIIFLMLPRFPCCV